MTMFDDIPLTEITLPGLRRWLAATRSALRDSTELLRLRRAECETEIIKETEGGLKGLGANEAAQSRALLVALEQKSPYTEARSQHHDLIGKVDRIEAEIAIAEDARRDRTINLRRKLVTVLAEAYGVDLSTLDADDDVTLDGEMDAALLAPDSPNFLDPNRSVSPATHVAARFADEHDASHRDEPIPFCEPLAADRRLVAAGVDSDGGIPN